MKWIEGRATRKVIGPLDYKERSANAAGETRREFMKMPLALAAASIVMPALLDGLAVEAKAEKKSEGVTIAPRYYPVNHFKPQMNLAGKLAVITGASRGNGRAVGEALNELGADVIGTSRNPAAVADPPAHPLLALDITDSASVLAFLAALQAHPLFERRRRVDILVNNAGRVVVGGIVPSVTSDFSLYLAQRDLAIRTVYSGHVLMTNAILPLMQQRGYSRILFMVSINSYMSGASYPGESFFDTYNSCKAALRVYANNLDSALRASGSSIRVTTVNPYFVSTGLAEHPHPIYTQPVNTSGLSDTDTNFNQVVTLLRQLIAGGLPASMVGDTCTQLLRMTDPEQNVVVASPQEPLATSGDNAWLTQQILAENQVSAVPFVCS